MPAIVIADTVKRIDDAAMVMETLDRAHIAHGANPQAFGFDLIVAAHRRAAAADLEEFTDDAALAEWAGHRVRIFEGETTNVKLTTNEDFTRAEALHVAALPDVRAGNGFDVHAFAAGDRVMLGGIRIPHSRGVTGHSDADVALMRSSTPFSARSPRATSASTSRQAIRNGAALRPTAFSASPASVCARGAA